MQIANLVNYFYSDQNEQQEIRGNFVHDFVYQCKS